MQLGSTGKVKFPGYDDDYIYRREKDYLEQQNDLAPFVRMMKRCIKMLSPIDQSILASYFIHGKGDYTEAVLKERAMEDTEQNRHWVQVRFSRAVDKLRERMGKMRQAYFDAMGAEHRPEAPMGRVEGPKKQPTDKKTRVVTFSDSRKAHITQGINYESLSHNLMDSFGL